MDNKYTNTDIFNLNECPSDALLLSYVKETISKEDKRKVELHLVDCDMCRDMVEGYQGMQLSNIDSNIKSIEIKIDEAVAAHNKKRGAASFKWYYAAAAILIIGLTGILYNFYFKSLDETQVADLPISPQEEISVSVDTIEKEGVKKSEIIQEEIASPAITAVTTDSENKVDAITDEMTTSEMSVNEVSEAPAELKKEEQLDAVEDAAVSNKSLKDNTTFGTTTLAQPAVTIVPNSESITSGATMNFTSPTSIQSSENLSVLDIKAVDIAIDKESTKKARFKTSTKNQDAKKDEAKAKQATEAVREKNETDDSSILTSANELLNQKKYNEALTRYTLYLKSHPKNCEAAKGIAQCYDLTDKISEAIASYTRLSQLKCDKASDAAYLKLGELYVKNKQSAEAKKVLQKAMQSKYLDIAEQAKKELDKL
jgi:TolA-binding protein